MKGEERKVLMDASVVMMGDLRWRGIWDEIRCSSWVSSLGRCRGSVDVVKMDDYGIVELLLV